MAAHKDAQGQAPRLPRWDFGWLAQETDAQDPDASAAFETHLTPMYVSLAQGNYEVAYALWERCDHVTLASASSRQTARFYFLGTEIALALEKWKDAYAHVRLCEMFIPKDDWVSLVQLNLKRGVCASYLKFFRLALNCYTYIIEHDPQGSLIPFRQGEWNSLLANAHLQRAQAAHGEGYFDQAQADIRQAIILINEWVQAHGLRATKGEGTQAWSTDIALLPLTTNPACQTLRELDRDTQTWLEIYHSLPWQYASEVLWAYNLNPHMITLNVWREARQTVLFAAESSQRFAMFTAYSVGLYQFAAEISLTMCENLPEDAWPTEIESAHHALTLAETISARQAAASPSALIAHELIVLTRYIHDYWLASWHFSQDGDTDRFAALAKQAEQFVFRMQKTHFLHLEGRGHFLMGQAYEYLEKVPYTALVCYRRALAIFEADQYFPRIAETQRAIETLLADYPELRQPSPRR